MPDDNKAQVATRALSNSRILSLAYFIAILLQRFAHSRSLEPWHFIAFIHCAYSQD
jgi:hypothetical protein